MPEYKRMGPAGAFISLHGPSLAAPPGQSNVTAKQKLCGELLIILLLEEDAEGPTPLKQVTEAEAGALVFGGAAAHAGGAVTMSVPTEIATCPLLVHEKGGAPTHEAAGEPAHDAAE